MDKTVSSTTLDLQALKQDAAIDQMAASSGRQSSQYATGLMDELFGEVDSILDGSLIPPSEPVTFAPAPEPKAPINLDFAAFLATPPSELAAMMANLSRNGAPLISPPAPAEDEKLEQTEPVIENRSDQARQESYGLFEKILIFVGCSSAMAAMVIWLGSQGTIGRIVAATHGTSKSSLAAVPPVVPPNPSDVKFSEYMGKSLESIDSKSKTMTNLVPIPLSPSALLPSVKVDNSTPQIILGGSGMSRLKPVPTPIGRTIPLTPTPRVGQPVSSVNTQSNLDQTVAKLSGLVDRMTGLTNRPIAAIPPTIRAAAPAAPLASIPAVAPAAAPQSEYTLSGVLGNGDKSVAMFQINGVGRNYEKGEKIGSSGWVFIRVDSGNAVVRRNGEVRILSAGQRL